MAGDTEGLQESQMRYAGIPDTKCVYPTETELAEWIEQRDTVQMAEALKKAVPDKKEMCIRDRYTNENIDRMLMERHLAKKARNAKKKHHLKGCLLYTSIIYWYIL